MDNQDSSDRPGGWLPPQFFGLAATEFWERFAMAGVKSILTLVLIDNILPGGAQGVFGVESARRLFANLFGPTSTVGLASQIYGVANALIYISIPLGGLFGDLIAGRQNSVRLAGLCMGAGLCLMIGRYAFLPGLALFAVGTGMLKGNLSAQVGMLFDDETRRRQGYAVYLAFLNAGIICGPLICGAVAAFAGWPYALAVAAIAIAIGIGGYHLAVREPVAAPQSQPAPLPAAMPARATGSVPLLLVALLSVYLCYAAYEQVGNIFLVWARAHVDLAVGGWNLPVAWFLSLDGLFTILLIVATQIGFRALRRRGLEIGPLVQIAFGCLACAAGYLVLVLGEWASGGGALPLGWALAYLVLVDLAVVLIWPSGLSLITDVAPPRLVGFWVGLFYLHGFFANLWVGFGGAYYERIAVSEFWLLHAGIAGAGAALALLVGLPLARAARTRQAITTSA